MVDMIILTFSKMYFSKADNLKEIVMVYTYISG